MIDYNLSLELPPEDFLRQLYREYLEDCERASIEAVSYETWLAELKADFEEMED